MYRVAVVDNEKEQTDLFVRFIADFCKETGEQIETVAFSSGVDFISDYQGDFDIVFMDIEMPELDGMETCKRLREADSAITIIFITNMAQFAIKGYEVNALDFVVKPVDYYCFSDKLKKSEMSRFKTPD